MKYILLVLMLVVTSCSISKNLDKTIKNLVYSTGCLRGVNALRLHLYNSSSKDLSQSTKDEMIAYCLALDYNKDFGSSED